MGRSLNLKIWVPTFMGIAITLVLSTSLFFHSDRISQGFKFIENHLSNLCIRYLSKPLPKDSPLLLVYIDDASLKEVGRWPWSRKKLAELATALHRLGASVVTYDMVFPEEEPNIGKEVLFELEKKSALSEETTAALKQAESLFDQDTVFAESLKQGTSVLGFAFSYRLIEQGVLPDPCLIFPKESSQEIPFLEMNGYLGNIEPLQRAAKYGGFINGFPDLDGTYRHSPILVQIGTRAFCSLGVEAVSLYLGKRQFVLHSEPYKNGMILQGISLGDRFIPLTPHGEMWIPYRRKGSRFSSVSAIDVMKGQVSREQVADKIVFIGFSASALGDLVSTPISPLVPGVNIQATIAAGILDGYLPYKPSWGKGVTVFLVFILGLFCSFIFPRVGAILELGLTLLLTGLLSFLGCWIWVHYQMIFFFTFPILTILLISIVTNAFGYFFESKRLQLVRAMFDQYVPPGHVELLCKQELGAVFKGENKELTILFSDIRGFTTLSESLTSSQVKEFLDLYFTMMSQIIFNKQGTIDKYIGDSIMAFWGAPLNDEKNALHAVEAALEMQGKLVDLNQILESKRLPSLKIGIGINTGMVHVGDMGSHFRRAYTVIGDAVNLASRLESLTKLCCADILVGQTTQEQTRDAIVYRNLGKVSVKGKTNQVTIYQPVCLAQQATDSIRSELQLYHEALDLLVEKKGDEARKRFQKLIADYPANQHLYESIWERMNQQIIN